MRRNSASLLVLATCQLVMAGAAQAQEAPAGTGPESADIIVTAERRTQSLQKLPTTATAISGEDLNRQQIGRVDDLIKSTPGLAINDAGLGKFINIRGIGKGVDAPGIAPGVAYYVDGVPMPNQVFLETPFFDLSRVEALRGPQGTLVGMNSTGGALLIVSQNPEFHHIGGSLEQSAGNYGDYRTRAMINIGGERVGLRVAGEIEDRDSFFTNVGPATDHPGNVKRRSVRATLALKPADGVQLFIRGEYNRNTGDGTTGKPIPGDPDPAYIFAFNPNSPTDPFSLGRFIDTFKKTEYFRVSGEARIDVGGAFELRSITAFQRGKLQIQNDVGATALPTAQQNISINEPVFTQEVNLISNPGGKFDWVVGAFYLHQDTNGLVNVVQFNAPPTPPSLVVNVVGRTRIRNFGLFGQTTYHASDVLNVTLGLRYNNEKHYLGPDGSTTIPTPGGNLTIPASNARTSDNALTGRLTVDYTVAGNHFLYATVSRGFKGGGINDPSPTPIFGPETVWNYELGLKSSFLERKIKTQLGFYYLDVNNLQYNVYNPITTQTAASNLSGGKAYGVEFQAQGQFGNLGLNTAVSYTKSEVDSQTLVDSRYGSNTPIQIGGRQFNFSPRFTFSAGAQYDIPVSEHYQITPRVQFSHQSSQWASFFHVSPTDLIEGRDLVDASIKLAPTHGTGFTLEAYVSNLFDRTYVASKAVEGSFLTPGRIQYYGAPRQFGVRAGYSF